MKRMGGWKKMWDGIWHGLSHNGRKELLSLLLQEYMEEAKISAQFQRHALRMQYPQFREQLRRIAAEEQQHAEWLKQRIHFLGGSVPGVSFAIEEGCNSWDHLRLDFEEERLCIGCLESDILKAESSDPETARGLRRILEDENRHLDAILDMMMRSDPQAVGTAPGYGAAHHNPQKH
jgi:bacterioferritin (cytochrome b1)